MKISKKTVITTITITLTLIISMFATVLPTATAHDPPLTIPTHAYVSAAPNPIGVNQQLLIMAWLHIVPPTSEGAYGDRWEGLTVEITQPDGTKKTLGPMTSDPVGSIWNYFTPTLVGEYTIQSSFPGQTLAGDNIRPGSTSAGIKYIGDYFEPSTSETQTFTVQEDPIPTYQDTPLPTGYWERPINAEHREWWSISGNWLGPPGSRYALNYAPYTKAPDTAHILWAQPLTVGGVVGGEHGVHTYHDGGAYEGKWSPPIIINGILYYNNYPTSYHIDEVTALDLRTGETVWTKEDIRISFGQIYMYDSPNQHGAFPYLWETQGSTWNAYDAYTGEYWFTIENVPGGTRVFGPKGEILRYNLDTTNHRLTMWNSTAITDLLGGTSGSAQWQWRPYGKTVDGADGITLNVTIPADLEGGSMFVLEDRIVGQTGLGRTDRWLYLPTEDYTLWAISLEPGREGTLLWKKTYSGSDNLTLEPGSASLDDSVFTLKSFQSRQQFGFSLETGEKLYTTQKQSVWDMFLHMTTGFAYGKLISTGYGGFVYAYDAQTGELLWEFEADDPTWEALQGGNYPLYFSGAADGKIYVTVSEHSPNDPKPRGSSMYALDAETGEELWRIPFYWPSWSTQGPAIADGILVGLSTLDNQIYAFGKGQTETTITASPKIIDEGSNILIEGNVNDMSPGAEGTPAIADESMSDWMKHLYMQFPIPGDAKGVNVALSAIDPNGNYQEIGTVQSDMSGMFKKMWTPPVPGEYTIIATFGGSGSYYSSYGETAIGVNEVETPPEPTPTPPPMTDTYITGSTIAILAGIAIAVFLILRKK